MGAEVADYLIELIFEGIDIDDSYVIDELASAEVLTAAPLGDGQVLLSAVVAQESALGAARDFVTVVIRAVPSAMPISASRDLVGVTDIADRIGVTREAVRHWSAGKRRDGKFPLPVGAPGGSKIWEWSAVHAWLRDNLGLWDELELPTHLEYAKIDTLLALWRTPEVATESVAPRRSTQWATVKRIPEKAPASRVRRRAIAEPTPEWSDRKPVRAEYLLAG